MKGIDAPVGMNRENRYFVNKIFIPLEVFMKASWNKDVFHVQSIFILNILEGHLALQLTNAKSKFIINVFLMHSWMFVSCNARFYVNKCSGWSVGGGGGGGGGGVL